MSTAFVASGGASSRESGGERIQLGGARSGAAEIPAQRPRKPEKRSEPDEEGEEYSDVAPQMSEELRESIMRQKRYYELMSDEEKERFEHCRRSRFPLSAVKEICSSVTQRPTSDDMAIALGGVSKMFVGEVIEAAMDVKYEMGGEESDPLRPEHLKEAFRRICKEGKVPCRPPSVFV